MIIRLPPRSETRRAPGPLAVGPPYSTACQPIPFNAFSAALLTLSAVIVAILIINSLQSGPKPDSVKACVVTDTHPCVFKGPGGLGFQSVPWLAHSSK